MKGKEICEELKRIRKEIARRNDIDYTPAECTHEGDCAGVCPTCEREAAYIMEELEKREAAGFPIDWDYNLASRMKDLEAERVRLQMPTEDCLVGICPNPNSQPHEYSPLETFILQGDVANPEGWNGETEEEEDVEKTKD